MARAARPGIAGRTQPADALSDFAPPAAGVATPAGTSRLKHRAVALLSRRDHSAVELQRKLARYAETPAQLSRVIDELKTGGWFSEQRFAEQMARRRGQLYGTQRVTQELRQHDLDSTLVAGLVAQLKESEVSRARVVWEKKFGTPGADANERARQYRFLAQRGFSSEAIRAVLRF